MAFSKTATTTELVTHAVRAAEVSAKIDAINGVSEALADMLRDLSSAAHEAGLSVPFRIGDMAEDMHNLRENLIQLRNDANSYHNIARTYLQDKETASAEAHVAALGPAELVDLIIRSKKDA